MTKVVCLSKTNYYGFVWELVDSSCFYWWYNLVLNHPGG